MPDAAHHARLKALFLQACALEPEERDRYLEGACEGDAGLRAEIEAMFAFEERRPDFLRRVEDLIPAPASLSLEAPLPTRLGAFRVKRCLGMGGMGTVYEVEQERPRRAVALKLLHPGLIPTAALRRFELEGEILARLQHPGIARIYEAGRMETAAGPQPYLAMEYVRGEPLTSHAQRRLSTARERLRLFTLVCDAVQHAHEQGVVHRDLKPANILVEDSGQPKVLDFGIARVTDGDMQLTTQHTRTGEIVGTLAYMSPEQASGDPDGIDARSDVYALGVLLYEVLAGELPYDVSSGSLPQAIDSIRQGEPRRISTVHRLLGGDVETIVGKALEKDRERRYPSAAALAADVRHFLAEEPIEARPPSRVYRVRKFVRRNRVLVAASSLVLASLVAGLAVSLRYGLAEAAARETAERSRAESRAQSYESGMLAAQLMLERGDVAIVLPQLESVPQEHRDWEWGALARQVDLTLAGLAVPGVVQAAYLDGEHVVHVDEGGTVGVWDTVTDRDEPLGQPVPGTRPLAFAPDGRWLLSHGEGLLFLSRVEPDEDSEPAHLSPADPLVLPFTGREPDDTSSCAAVLNGGARLAVATVGGGVELVDVGEPPVTTTLVEASKGINLLRFSPDGRYLMVAGPSRTRLMDLDSRTERWSRNRSTARFDSTAFDPAGARVALGIGLGIEVHDLLSGETLLTWSGQALDSSMQGSPFRLDYDPTGRHLAALFRGGLLRILDAESGRQEATARPDPGWMTSDLAWSPDGTTVLTCGRTQGTLRLWNGEPASAQVMAPTSKDLYGLALSPDGELVAAGASDGVTHVWEIATGRQIAELASVRARVRSVVFSPDGRRLVCSLGRPGFALWDTRSGTLLARVRKPWACSAAYTPDGSRLVLGTVGGEVRLLDATSLEEIASCAADESNVQSLACSPDGRWIAVGTASGRVALLDASSGALVASALGPKGGAREYQGTLALAFSPDSRWLATGSGSSRLALCSVPGLAVERTLVGHREEVFGLAFLPDGKRLVSGGRDGRLRVWNPETGGLLLSLDGHRSYVWGVAVTADGRRIATSSGDGTVRVWDSAPASIGWRERRLAERDRRRLTGELDRLAESRDVPAALEQLVGSGNLGASERRVSPALALERSQAGASEPATSAAGGPEPAPTDNP